MAPCRRRRCREVHAAQIASDAAAAKIADVTVDKKILSVEGEAARLWNHVIFGTGTCVGMLLGYAKLRMPGDPRKGLYALRDQLNLAIKTVEETHEDSTPTSVDSDHPTPDS